MPLYLNSLHYNNSMIANIDTAIDIGGLFGTVVLGYFSDKMYSYRSPVLFGAALFAVLF